MFMPVLPPYLGVRQNGPCESMNAWAVRKLVQKRTAGKRTTKKRGAHSLAPGQGPNERFFRGLVRDRQ